MHGNMPITPADLGIPQSEVDQSQNWWRAMSINEWKALEGKHHILSFLRGRWKTVHEIWLLQRSVSETVKA